ncbi:MAG: hypothetical protein ACRCYU_20665 [Nocardioides sp.]
MSRIHIKGLALNGTVVVTGSKACVPPLLGLEILNGAAPKVVNAPESSDLTEALRILTLCAPGAISSRLPDHQRCSDPASLYKRPMRSRAILPLTGLLAHRLGRVTLPLPGGCRIGERRIDTHLQVLGHFGIAVESRKLAMHVEASCRPSRYDLTLNRLSVGASLQAILLAIAVGEQGRSVHGLISVTETEFLLKTLARLGVASHRRQHDGTLSLTVIGTIETGSLPLIRVPKDDIEAGSWLVGGLAAGGELRVGSSKGPEIVRLVTWLRASGANVVELEDGYAASQQGAVMRMRPIDTRLGVHTDFVLPAAALARCQEQSPVVADHVFPHRAVAARLLAVEQPRPEIGVPDIRAGFANLIMALRRWDEFTVADPDELLSRGYPRLIAKLNDVDLSAVECGRSGKEIRIGDKLAASEKMCC